MTNMMMMMMFLKLDEFNAILERVKTVSDK